MEYIQKITLSESEMQQSNAADEVESVKVQLCVMHALCVLCPAGTSGGLCQHVFALLILLQHHAPVSS